MSGFPKLIPAFKAHVYLEKPAVVGQVSKGSTLIHVGFVPGSGFVKAVDGYPIKLDAVFHHGADYINRDADGKHVRLDVSSLLNDASGAVIKFDYVGTIDITGPAGKVLGGAADAATTDFGDAFTHVRFETAAPELAELQNKVYVGCGRFIVQEGSPVIVEYMISEVAL